MKFRAEKRTALCAHPTATVLQWWREWRTDIVEPEDVVRLIYLYFIGKHEFLAAVYCKENKATPVCCEPGSLAYIISDLLVWMQYVKSVCG